MAKDFEEKVLKKLDKLSGQIGSLDSDVGGLKEDVGTLKSDVGGLKGSLRRLEVLHEETIEKIDQIIETVSPEIQKNNEQDSKLEDHEGRISQLELAA